MRIQQDRGIELVQGPGGDDLPGSVVVREADGPEPGWVPTDEVFRDPVTDRLMRVWADGGGQRHYLPERSGPVGPG